MSNIDKKEITEDMRTELRKDFPDKAYSKHPTKTFLTTLKAMYVTERLNDVFGVGRWSINHEVIERTNDYVLIQGEFISLDYDVITPKQYGGHKTSGTNTEIADGYKSAITDCISKIASYLEIGIEMFKGNISNGSKASKTEESDLPWLNEKDLPNVIKGALDKGLKPEELRKYYKISKKVMELVKAGLI